MGLSSSQARLLTLTARQHSIEYNAQRLQAQKLQLANESDQAYNKYLERLDATKVQYKVVTDDGSIRYNDATFTKLQSTGKYMFKVGDKYCKSFSEVKDALNDKNGPYKLDITASDSYTVLATLIAEGLVILMEVADDAEAGFSFENGEIVYTDPVDASKKTTYKDNGYIPPGGALTSYDPDENYEKMVYKVFKDTSVSTSTSVQEVSDEVGLKKAEAQYEADMNRINSKDARYDTELSQLETERNAIKSEIDTLKTVAKDNVDRTFKIFG